MSGLTLLCSYPKSGNTWLRAVLSEIEGASLKLHGGLPFGMPAIRRYFDEFMGIDSSELTADEIALARAAYCRALAEAADLPRIWKVHDCFHPPRKDIEPPFPPDALSAVVYIVRDPRDVAVSFANHFGKTIDEAIARMADEETRISRSVFALKPQLSQYLSSWSGHVESWLDAPGIKLHLLRYEDMLADPEKTFAAALDFLGIEFTRESLAQALHACRFEVLQASEAEEGFSERPPGVEKFFRRGVAGGWRDTLSENQAAHIVAAHGRVMRRLGYLS